MSKRIDNDATKNLAMPFLILAHVRTGGTFVAHALSNHPQVYCDRGETLHHLSAWRKNRVPVPKILGTIWKMDGYHAAGFRAIYRQAFHPDVWPIVEMVQPHIIHLVRRNMARQGVSFAYQQLVRQGKLPFHPVHSFNGSQPDMVAADPRAIVALAMKVRREMEKARSRLASYRGQILETAYEDVTGDREAGFMADGATTRIEDFLNIQPARLPVLLRRDFNMPMSQWFTNWPEIRKALKKEKFEGLDG